MTLKTEGRTAHNEEGERIMTEEWRGQKRNCDSWKMYDSVECECL